MTKLDYEPQRGTSRSSRLPFVVKAVTLAIIACCMLLLLYWVLVLFLYYDGWID